MKYTLWLKIAIAFQLLTGLIHSISFLNQSEATNDTEKTLLDLMNNYKMDMGAGISRSTNDLLIALSACFTLIYLFGGMINWYLLRKKTDVGILRGIITIHTVIFGISFAIMVRFAFLPPIILTGMVFLFLLITLITIPKTL